MVTHQELLLIQKSEIKANIVKYSELIERGSRLNAEYYNAEGKRVRKIIQNYSKGRIGIKMLLTKAFVPPPIKRVFTDYKKSSIPYLTPSDLLTLNPKATRYIIGTKMNNIDDWYIKENWLILTQSGTVGLPILGTKRLEKFVVSQNAIRLLFNNVLDAHFYYIFFKSKLGHALITTNNYGSVVTHIEPEHIEALEVPNPPLEFKETVSANVEKILKLREIAVQLIEKADSNLHKLMKLSPLDSFGRENFEKNEFMNFEVKASKVNLRFEAFYHNPVIKKIKRNIEISGSEITNLSNKRVSEDIILPGRFKRIYVEEEKGVPFLGGKEITQNDQADIKFLSLKKHGERINKELLFKENMILITCSGTVGNIVLCPKHYENWTGSQHIIRIVPSESINPGYVFAYLSSDIGRQLIIRNKYGSVVDEIDDNQISSIPIPLPERPIQDAIGNLVLEANKMRTEAYYLERKTIEEVEKHIMEN